MSMKEVIWITGSASGVGKHLTQAFLKRGYAVIATDINLEGLTHCAKQAQWPADQVLLRSLDVRDRKQWQSVLENAITRWGKVDRLLNVAGYLKPGYIHETDAEEIDRHIDINVKGLITGSQLLARHFVQQGQGHIINIASLAGIAPIPGIALYSTSKFAVRGFSLALAQELQPLGVAVSVICPDAIQTPMLTLQEDYEEAALTFSGGKTLSVEDIEAVLFEKVLKHKTLEVSLPFTRGIMAKVGNAAPAVAFMLGEYLKKKGRKAQHKRQSVPRQM